MKICWDNLERIRFSKRGSFIVGKETYYYEHDACIECGDSFLCQRKSEEYCDSICRHRSEKYRKNMSISLKGRIFTEEHKQKMKESRKRLVFTEETRKKMSDSAKVKIFTDEHKHNMKEAQKGERGNNWNGYSSYNIPMYDTYAPQLEPYEQCRRNTDDPNILEVRCTYCGKWYKPRLVDVKSRLTGISNNDGHRFYCSDGCKQECPIFGRHKYYKGQKGYNSREVQPELRQMVLARDNYICVKCGSTGPLHCHHIEPVVSNPIESADIDNCITFCIDCHKEAHKLPGCTYSELAGCNG